MAFVFRLERVLSVRRIQEESARQRHAEAQEEECRAARAVEELRSRLRLELEALDQRKHRDELTEQALYLHSLHLAGLRRKTETALIQLTAAKEQVRKSASALLEAHQAREALERLREREQQAWRKQQAKREASAIDEIAVMRHRAREEENHGP